MRQKESFFLISIKRPRASLRGGGAALSQAVRIYANVVTCVSCVSCVSCVVGVVGVVGVTRDELFSLNRYVRALNMYVRMKHQYEV